jgi:soluble lytic murein transglycosylase
MIRRGFFTILIASSIAANAAFAAQTTYRDPAQVARVAHAKELLGKNYKKVARATDDTRNIRKYVTMTVKKSLPAKWKYTAPAVAHAILDEAVRYGFDPIFIVSVIQTESAFNPEARGTSGEIGLMQLMPDTGKWIAGDFDIRWKGTKTLSDPVQNVRLGAAYLSLLREKFGADGRLYLPAYNMGPTAVRHAVDQEIIPVDYARRVMKKYLKNYALIQVQIQKMRLHPILKRRKPLSKCAFRIRRIFRTHPTITAKSYLLRRLLQR